MTDRDTVWYVPFLCTYHRDGVVCGRYEDDKSVHVAEDERMRRGAHVWRHEPKDAHLVADLPEPPVGMAEANARRAIAGILDKLPPDRRAAVLDASRREPQP